MEVKILLVLLAIISILLSFSSATSMDLCPDEDLAKILIGSHWVDVPPQQTTALVRRVRLPPIGLYDNHITCVLVTDISLDDTGGSVYITDGGLGHRFIEVRFNSLIGQGLDYVILAYANDSNLGHNSTYAKL